MILKNNYQVSTFTRQLLINWYVLLVSFVLGKIPIVKETGAVAVSKFFRPPSQKWNEGSPSLSLPEKSAENTSAETMRHFGGFCLLGPSALLAFQFWHCKTQQIISRRIRKAEKISCKWLVLVHIMQHIFLS